jgi:hypothetical protein
MLEQERVKLLFGPYRTPKCKVGRCLRCAMRGKVTVAGLSDAPDPMAIARLWSNRGASPSRTLASFVSGAYRPRLGPSR